jgi:CRISPR-associated exonuclease Cas4
MAWLFAALFLLALFAAFAFWRSSRKQRRQTGLPLNARVVYTDTGVWKKVERPLFSRRYQLTGKPDYIVEEDGALIPVEVKPSRVAKLPHESDVMQLAAYALLIEETHGTAPRYGLLKYRDAVFQIDFTDEVRARLLDLMDTARQDFTARDVARSHAELRRCRVCGYRAECGQALEE